MGYGPSLINIKRWCNLSLLLKWHHLAHRGKIFLQVELLDLNSLCVFSSILSRLLLRLIASDFLKNKPQWIEISSCSLYSKTMHRIEVEMLWKRLRSDSISAGISHCYCWCSSFHVIRDKWWISKSSILHHRFLQALGRMVWILRL